MESCIFETSKNSMMTHGWHIYQIVSDVAMDTMCD